MTNSPDNRISEALSEDDQAFLDSLEAERGMFQQIGDTWKGPLGGWAKLIFGFTVAVGLLFVFVIWKTATTIDNVAAHTLWAIMGVALLVVLGFAKEWMFARMNMLTVLREIKRLQLEVALLREEAGLREATQRDAGGE
ncbi:MAG: DUF6768 family protein [Pseudomonadota bacterium]